MALPAYTRNLSVSFAVNSGSDDRQAEAALELIRFWNSTESQTTWALGSGFPPNRTDIPPEDLSANPYTIDFGAHADIARFSLINVQEFTTINTNIFEPALQRLLNGEGSVEELFPAACEEAQAVLDEQ